MWSTATDLVWVEDPRLKEVRDHLDYLEEVWPDVVELRTPSNRARVGGRRHVSDHAIESARLLELEESIDRHAAGAVVPPGRRPVPVELDALDLMARIVGTVEQVCSWIVQAAGVEQLDPVDSVYVDPRPYMRRARAYLTAAVDADSELLAEVVNLLGPIAAAAAAFLGDVLDGQVLDALCPWCSGRSESRPPGGERTLRVSCPGARRRDDDEDPLPPMIICHGLNCEPPKSASGLRHGGRPAWPEREWDWLAKKLLSVTA